MQEVASKVIHEGSDETVELKQAQEWICDCTRLYFLGFGYDPTNVERLKIESLEPKKKLMMGTIYGLSLGRIRDVQDLCKCHTSSIFHDKFLDKKVCDFLHDKVNLIMG